MDIDNVLLSDEEIVGLRTNVDGQSCDVVVSLSYRWCHRRLGRFLCLEAVDSLLVGCEVDSPIRRGYSAGTWLHWDIESLNL